MPHLDMNITSMPSIQYRKQIRQQAARSQPVSAAADVAQAGFNVGNDDLPSSVATIVGCLAVHPVRMEDYCTSRANGIAQRHKKRAQASAYSLMNIYRCQQTTQTIDAPRNALKLGITQCAVIGNR